jgi:predicted Zn finger-like uncharacterized protein
MILTCPNCDTQYVVKDGAIPPGGRQVRCASCKHSWHQDPEGEAPLELETPPAPAPGPVDEGYAPSGQEESVVDAETPDDEDETFAEATLIEPRSGPEAEERAYEEALVEQADEAEAPTAEPTPSYQPTERQSDRPLAGLARGEAVAADWREPPMDEVQDDEFSPFPSSDEVAPRRRSPVITILLVVIIVAAAAAAFWFFAPPEWKARLGLAAAGASPLALITTHMDRQKLESGNELLTVTGRVVNPTSKEQDVPPIQAQLKTHTGQVVYSWTIAPPARSLPPGSSASFNSAEVNVPAGGEELTISLGPPSA